MIRYLRVDDTDNDGIVEISFRNFLPGSVARGWFCFSPLNCTGFIDLVVFGEVVISSTVQFPMSAFVGQLPIWVRCPASGNRDISFRIGCMAGSSVSIAVAVAPPWLPSPSAKTLIPTSSP